MQPCMKKGKMKEGADETAGWEKVFAAKPDDLSLISRSHKMERVSQLLNVFL